MSRPYRALYELLRIPGALPRAGMYSPFRAGRASRTAAQSQAAGEGRYAGAHSGLRATGATEATVAAVATGATVAAVAAEAAEGGSAPLRTGLWLRRLRWLRVLRGRAVRRCAPQATGQAAAGRPLCYRSTRSSRRYRSAEPGRHGVGAENALKGLDIPALGNAQGWC
jgi:hypothetical protein